MIIEDELPERFKRNAFHPSAFIYAFKHKDLEKLFEELLQSNIAIQGVEAWYVQGVKINHLIPLKKGQIKVFEYQNKINQAEEWYDFVERAAKEALEIIAGWDLEREAGVEQRNKIWYHLDLIKS